MSTLRTRKIPSGCSECVPQGFLFPKIQTWLCPFQRHNFCFFFKSQVLQALPSHVSLGITKNITTNFGFCFFVLCSVLTPGLIENDVKQQQWFVQVRQLLAPWAMDKVNCKLFSHSKLLYPALEEAGKTARGKMWEKEISELSCASKKFHFFKSQTSVLSARDGFFCGIMDVGIPSSTSATLNWCCWSRNWKSLH